MKTFCDVLRVDPSEYIVSLKYVFNSNIPIALIQVRDDGDVKYFIWLNCNDGKLHVPLCITIEKINDNHEFESIMNTDFSSQLVNYLS